ncbi:unnamed protein product [Lampetra planeri]
MLLRVEGLAYVVRHGAASGTARSGAGPAVAQRHLSVKVPLHILPYDDRSRYSANPAGIRGPFSPLRHDATTHAHATRRHVSSETGSGGNSDRRALARPTRPSHSSAANAGNAGMATGGHAAPPRSCSVGLCGSVRCCWLRDGHGTEIRAKFQRALAVYLVYAEGATFVPHSEFRIGAHCPQLVLASPRHLKGARVNAATWSEETHRAGVSSDSRAQHQQQTQVQQQWPRRQRCIAETRRKTRRYP